ncbi:MAG: hypothetical protein ACOCZ8_00985 [Bacteroidota bacterium]
MITKPFPRRILFLATLLPVLTLAQPNIYESSTREVTLNKPMAWELFGGFEIAPSVLHEAQITGPDQISYGTGGFSLGVSTGLRRHFNDQRYLNLSLDYRLQWNSWMFNTAIIRAEHEWRPRRIGWGVGLGTGLWWSGDLLFEIVPSPQASWYVEPGVHLSVAGKREHAEFIFGINVAHFRMDEEWEVWSPNGTLEETRVDLWSYTVVSFRMATRFGFRPVVQFRKHP